MYVNETQQERIARYARFGSTLAEQQDRNDALVERLMRQLVRARRLGDEAGHAILWGRFEAAIKASGLRPFDRALAIVDWHAY